MRLWVPVGKVRLLGRLPARMLLPVAESPKPGLPARPLRCQHADDRVIQIQIAPGNPVSHPPRHLFDPARSSSGSPGRSTGDPPRTTRGEPWIEFFLEVRKRRSCSFAARPGRAHAVAGDPGLIARNFPLERIGLRAVGKVTAAAHDTAPGHGSNLSSADSAARAATSP